MAVASRFSLFLVLSLSILSQTLAQAPAPDADAGPPNIAATLNKQGNQYAIFLRLLNETQIINQVQNQLNSTNNGFTVLAPTDNAFNNLPSGALNGLDQGEKTQLLQYHIIPQFLTFTNLLTVSNPVTTLAGGKDGAWGLNFTGQNNQVNVSSGVVVTQIYNPLRQVKPLAVYQLDKVLLPEELFGKKDDAATPAAAPEPGKKGSSGSNATKSDDGAADSPAGDNNTGGAPGRNMGFGVVLGLVMAFFFS